MGHFLQDVEITNFKSIRHQKIEGCRRINVFIGYPNVGKSNILEAIGCLGLPHLINRADEFHFADLVRLDNLNQLFFEADTALECGVRIDEGVGCSFRQTGKQYLVAFYNDASPTGAPGGTAELALGYSNDAFSERESFNRRLSQWKDQLAGSGVLNDFPSVKTYKFRPAGAGGGDGKSPLAPNGENLAQQIAASPRLRKEIAELFSPYGQKVLFDQSAESIRVFKTLSEEIIFSLPLEMVADTLQRMIFYKAAIASNQNAVLIFEEPEAHMFPPYIRSLMWDVVSSKDNQFFIATHSPFVLDMLMEEAAEEVSVYLVDMQEGATQMTLLSEEEFREVRDYGVDLFFNIESYLNAREHRH